jgi:hypothetical protein
MIPKHVSITAIVVVSLIIFYFCPISVLILGLLCTDAYFFQKRNY